LKHNIVDVWYARRVCTYWHVGEKKNAARRVGGGGGGGQTENGRFFDLKTAGGEGFPVKRHPITKLRGERKDRPTQTRWSWPPDRIKGDC